MNPEELEVIGFAVLRHGSNDRVPTSAIYAAIDEDVRALIADHTEQGERLLEGMKRALDQRGDGSE